MHAPWNQRLSLCWSTQAAPQRMPRSGGPGWGSWGPSAREPHAPSCKGRRTSAPRPPGGPDRSCNRLRKAWHNFNGTSAHSTEEAYKELVVQLWGCFSHCHAKLEIKKKNPALSQEVHEVCLVWRHQALTLWGWRGGVGQAGGRAWVHPALSGTTAVRTRGYLCTGAAAGRAVMGGCLLSLWAFSSQASPAGTSLWALGPRSSGCEPLRPLAHESWGAARSCPLTSVGCRWSAWYCRG